MKIKINKYVPGQFLAKYRTNVPQLVILFWLKKPIRGGAIGLSLPIYRGPRLSIFRADECAYAMLPIIEGTARQLEIRIRTSDDHRWPAAEPLY